MPYVHVEVDLEEFDDDEIIQEYKARGLGHEGQTDQGLPKL